MIQYYFKVIIKKVQDPEFKVCIITLEKVRLSNLILDISAF